MKLSYAISTQPTSFASVAAGNWEDKVSKIADLGYHGVELAIRDPRAMDLVKIERLLSQTGLELVAIGTGQAYLAEGLFLASEDEAVRQAAVERIGAQVDIAAQFKSLVILGLIRGGAKKGDGYSEAKLIESLKAVCLAAQEKNVKIVLEPINRYEISSINNVAQALDLIERVGSQALQTMLDSFHMNIEEREFAAAIKLAAPRLAHFHIADSDRWYPGHGHVDFNKIVRTLLSVGYQGYLSGEMMPLPDFDQAAEMTVKNVSRIIKEEAKA